MQASGGMFSEGHAARPIYSGDFSLVTCFLVSIALLLSEISLLVAPLVCCGYPLPAEGKLLELFHCLRILMLLMFIILIPKPRIVSVEYQLGTQ